MNCAKKEQENTLKQLSYLRILEGLKPIKGPVTETSSCSYKKIYFPGIKIALMKRQS